jgi:signal recognition particle subunit SRP54
MFGNLTKKFQGLFSAIGKSSVITEKNISEAVKEARLALLEADVNYSVANSFVNNIKEKALGESVIKSLKPKEKFIKIIHDELINIMGKDEISLDLNKKPSVIMLCGLQGSGKTTTCAKLALFLKNKNKKVLLAGCDLQRPAAMEQLKTLASQIDVEVFLLENEKKPVNVAKQAYKKLNEENFDVLILDTAGRLHVDNNLMQELEELKKAVSTTDILFVANATTGQDAVTTASKFDERINITGSILTMLDGNSRAGAALSIREVTQKPLMFEGIGEKISDFQVFSPHSMADRILGRGDIINLARKAEENFQKVGYNRFNLLTVEKLEDKSIKSCLVFLRHTCNYSNVHSKEIL